MNLDGRVALVTGSTTGLGKAIALALARSGATIALNYHNDDSRGLKALSEFESAGIRAMLFKADVSTQKGAHQLISDVSDRLGPVDILIPNATPEQLQKRIEDYQWDEVQQMLDFFVKSPFLLSQACIPHMKQQRWGRIINIISEVFSLGIAPFSAYAAAKGGQVGFSRSLATELAPFGITVNMISPGWIPVERHKSMPQSIKDSYLQTIPLGRWGVPDDIASAACFFASNEASFVTGQFVTINGGRSYGL